MAADRRYYRLTCTRCSNTTVVGPELLLRRMREAGILRRQKDPSVEVMVELLPVAAAQFCCEACDHTGLSFELVDDEWHDEAWGQQRACESCGGLIPAERVELFPAVKLCVACRRAEEKGEPDQAEYCPRCGTIMVTKLRSGAGIAGYRLFCPACQR